MSAIYTGRNGRVDPGPFYGVKTPYTHDPGDYTLISAQSGFIATNEGAAGIVLLRAPVSPVIGNAFALRRLSAYPYPFRFKPTSGHQVEGEALDKYIELMGPGEMIFEYTRANIWSIAHYTCIWNPEP